MVLSTREEIAVLEDEHLVLLVRMDGVWVKFHEEFTSDVAHIKDVLKGVSGARSTAGAGFWVTHLLLIGECKHDWLPRQRPMKGWLRLGGAIVQLPLDNQYEDLVEQAQAWYDKEFPMKKAGRGR